MTKNVSVFPPFIDDFTRQKANHGVFFEQYSRFTDITSVEEFIEGQENNTKKNTEQNVALLKEFLKLIDDSRPVEEIAPQELSSFISEFIIAECTKRKKTSKNTTPIVLRAMMASFERHLRKKNYGYSIMRDLEFEKARTALKLKQKDLKKKGKGRRNQTLPFPSQKTTLNCCMTKDC